MERVSGYRVGRSRSRTRSISPLRGNYNRHHGSSHYNARQVMRSHGLHSGLRNHRSSESRANMLMYPLKSFRDFVVTMDANVKPENAAIEYEKYKSSYQLFHSERLIKNHKSDGFILERYHPTSYKLQNQQQLTRCHYTSEKFFDEDMNGNFNEIDLSVSVSEPVKLGTNVEWTNRCDVDVNIEKNLVTVEKSSNNPNDPEGVSKHQVLRTHPPFYVYHPAITSVVVEDVGPDISKWDIDKNIKDKKGYLGILISSPRLDCEMTRIAWLLFDTMENRNNGLAELSSSDLTFGKYKVEFVEPDLPLTFRALVTAPCMGYPQRIEKDILQANRLIRKLDKEWGIEASNGSEYEQRWTKLLVGKTSQQILDIQITYLRRVHLVCYYSGKRCNDEIHLWTTCGACCLRPKLAEEDLVGITEAEEKWMNELDSKLAALLNENQKKKEVEHEKLIEIKWQAYCEEHTIKVEDEKFRCDICRKLFKGQDYVAKHLRLKHEDAYGEVCDQVCSSCVVSNYMEDPDKIIIYPERFPYGNRGITHAERDLARGDDSSYRRFGSKFSSMNNFANQGHRIPYGLPTDWDKPTARTPLFESETASRKLVTYDDL